MKKINWPQGKDFAFTIVDDTDHATVKRVKPIYDLLYELGFKTTKTVWTFSHENDRFDDTETLEDPEYLVFIKELANKGFEIASHGARGISSEREITIKAFDAFYNKLGFYPKMHINHAQNKDNLYCTFNRLFKIQKILHHTGIRKYSTRGTGYGGNKSSAYFWGDIALKHIEYVRSGNFKDINTFNCDPNMPYHEKRFPYVNAWFSGSDGANFFKFIELLSENNQRKLQSENGLCIIYTHFGLDHFINKEGTVNSEIKDILISLSQKNGWFVPATTILDYLKQARGVKQVNPILQWYKIRKSSL